MASGKKGKKTKGKTVPLTDFLQETTGGSVPTQSVRKSTFNWADEVEDYDGFGGGNKTVNVVLPTAPKASRDYDDFNDKVPKDPPFMAYLSNLPYDVDEDDLAAFFKDMRIASIRIPKDDRSSDVPRSKGYGYIEFEDRQSLLDALVLPDTHLKNRRMRIDVASNVDERRRGGAGGRDRSNQMTSGDSSSTGDWRSGPRTEVNIERNEERRGGGGGGGGFRDRERDGGFNRSNRDRDVDDRPGGWREGGDRDRGLREQERDRDRGFIRRDGDDNRSGFRRFENRDRERDRERDSGFNSSRSNRDERDRDEHMPSEQRERPRLVLAPRTKPIETPTPAPPISKQETSAPSASIFGNARPVDTAKREMEIEEKLKKEQENKEKGMRDNSRERERERDRNRPTIRMDMTRRSDDDNSRERDRRRDASNEMDKKGGDEAPGHYHQDMENRDRPSSRRNFDDKRHNIKNNEKSPEKNDNLRHNKNEKSKMEKRDKEMPKMMEPEPPIFTANNKFAFLQTDDNSD